MILWFSDSFWNFRNCLEKSGLGSSEWESLLMMGLDGSSELLKWVANRETGFSCGNLGHQNRKLLSLDAWEGSQRNKTQTRGCFTKRYLQGQVLLRKRGKGGLQPSVIPRLAHQTSAEWSWTLWLLLPYMNTHLSPVAGSPPWVFAVWPNPPQCHSHRKKGGVKWKQLLGSENKGKLSG